MSPRMSPGDTLSLRGLCRNRILTRTVMLNLGLMKIRLVSLMNKDL
jgi:hypothetical protein